MFLSAWITWGHCQMHIWFQNPLVQRFWFKPGVLQVYLEQGYKAHEPWMACSLSNACLRGIPLSNRTVGSEALGLSSQLATHRSVIRRFHKRFSTTTTLSRGQGALRGTTRGTNRAATQVVAGLLTDSFKNQEQTLKKTTDKMQTFKYFGQAVHVLAKQASWHECPARTSMTKPWSEKFRADLLFFQKDSILEGGGGDCCRKPQEPVENRTWGLSPEVCPLKRGPKRETSYADAVVQVLERLKPSS